MLNGRQRCALPRPVQGWRSGDDAIPVVGVALRSHQCLATAVRTSNVIATAGPSAVILPKEQARGVCSDLDRPVAVIDDFVGVTKRPTRVELAALVSGVGHRRSISAADFVRERWLVDIPG